MLKQRVITGALLVAAVLLVLVYAGDKLFALLTAAMMLIAAWEWSKLSGFDHRAWRVGFVVCLAIILLVIWFVPVMLVELLACLWWLLALYWVLKYPKKTAQWSSRPVRAIMGVLVLAPSWLAINVIHSSQQGALVLLFLLILVWSADTGAYFVGKWRGRRKLMPNVSPGKTWEGFLGGLFVSMLVATVVSVDLKFSDESWFVLMLAVILLNVYAVVGDLFESLLKRYCQVKDSGTILPGHGGILDRIDSLTAAAPLFLLGLLLYQFY
jgi:phosphatidate cytidylyltransferase